MNLRYYILLAFTVTSFITKSGAQGKEDFNKQLFTIQQEYQSINRDHGYVITTMEGVKIPGRSTGTGAHLTAYYKNDSLKKLVEVTGKADGSVTTEYYVYNGQLVFVSCKEKKFVRNEGSNTYDYTRFTLGAAAKYYFDNDKLVNATFTGGGAACANTKDKDAEQFLVAVKEYGKVLKEKK